jgi:hypothetical protein
MKRRTPRGWAGGGAALVFLTALVLVSLTPWLAGEGQPARATPTRETTWATTPLPLIEGLLPSPEATATLMATLVPIPPPAPTDLPTATAGGIPYPPPWSGPVDRPWTMYDGYWNEEWWIPGMISNFSWFLSSPQYHYGRATFYTEGRMEATAHARGMSLDGYLDGVSLMSPANIGNVVWLRPEGMEWTGPYLVVDCAQRDDILQILGGRDEAVEVGYTTAIRWGMIQPHRRCCWVEDLVIHQYSLDRVYVFIGQFLPPTDVLAQHEPFHLAPWWLARAELEDFSDSPFWFPDPAPIQGQYGQWIYYDDGERFEATHFPLPEAFWP